MDLKTALTRAVKFAAKPKEECEPALKLVRFLPGLEGERSRVFATNGVLGALFVLDEDIEVQNAAAPAELCAQMARESNAILSMLWDGKGLQFITRRKAGAEPYQYKMPAGNIAAFPAFQTPPEPMPFVQNWHAVKAVVHAASGPKVDDQVFRCVRFTPKVVEATDRFRVARAEVEGDWLGLVPSELFDNWPRGDVQARFTALTAFFRIGDETRYATLMHGKFPDTRTVVPEEHRGACALVPVDALRSAVKRAAKMTKVKTVRLEFLPESVRVSSWTSNPEEQFLTTFQAKVAEEGSVLVKGDNLAEALREVHTPRILVGYGREPTDLLRLESGRLTMSLWPWLEPAAEEAPAWSQK